MKELAELGSSEEWGGSTLMAKISAKKKTGIKELMELILLQAEMLNSRQSGQAGQRHHHRTGLDKGHGPVGTVMVREGTLSVHDPVCGRQHFRPRQGPDR